VETDVISGAAPEKLSFQPQLDGAPQHYFNYSSDGLHPVVLPATNKRVLVVRDAKLVRLVMSDSRFSLAQLNPSEDTVTGTGYQSLGGMLRLDLPHIRRIRREIMPYFSARGITRWRQEVEQVADSLIKTLAAGCRPADLNKRYFEPLIVRSVAQCAGIADNESEILYHFSNSVLVRVEHAEDRDRISKAWRELYDHIRVLLVKKINNPDGGLLSKIFAAFKNAGLSDDEIAATSGTIPAGFYTPFGILSVAAVELFQHPDVVEACQEQPALWERTVEELMRYKAHFNFFLPRVATEDVTLEGLRIRAGKVLLPSLHAAVTDPVALPEPQRVRYAAKSGMGKYRLWRRPSFLSGCRVISPMVAGWA
jgi:cytochrome P450